VLTGVRSGPLCDQ